jgi:hypothetical protein
MPVPGRKPKIHGSLKAPAWSPRPDISTSSCGPTIYSEYARHFLGVLKTWFEGNDVQQSVIFSFSETSQPVHIPRNKVTRRSWDGEVSFSRLTNHKRDNIMGVNDRPTGSEPGTQKGGIGYVLLWLMGVPIPLLILFALLRGCA